MKTLLLFTTAFLLSITNLSAQLAGNSLHMDGVDDYVVCTVPAVFDDITTNDFTIEMWVKQGKLTILSFNLCAKRCQ